MKKGRLWVRTNKFVSVLLVIGLAFSMVFVTTPVHAAAIISHPGGTIIDVDEGAILFSSAIGWNGTNPM